MRTRRYLLLAAILTFQSGCWLVMKEKFLAEEFKTEKVELPFWLAKVKVVDRRENVSKKDIVIPTMSVSTKKKVVSPPLTQETIDLVKAELTPYFRGSTQSVIALVEVLAAEKQFQAGWQGERETVVVRIKVTLADGKTQSPFIYAIGESSLFIQTLDASEEYTAKLYAKGIRVCLYQAAKSLKAGLQ
jgi:hypothetical protein